MSMIDPPNVFQTLGIPILGWMNRAYVLLFSIQQSGLSADRPTENLFIGRKYYATDLGKPIFLHSVGTTNVWHDANGAVV